MKDVRLRAVASLVPAGSRVLDVGCDHAGLDILLLEEGRALRCIASDIGEGPLQNAKNTLEHCAPEIKDRITLRLAGGLAGLAPQEADCIVCAGMGGALILRIIETADFETLGIRTLVLQPQSEAEDVRRFQRERGCVLFDERCVEEDGHFYTAMAYHTAAVTDAPLSEALPLPERVKDRYGPVLLRERDPVLYRLLQKEAARYEAALWQAKEASDGAARTKELQQYLDDTKDALRLWEGVKR